MPGPRSVTSTEAPLLSPLTRMTLGSAPCSRALSMRFATTRSSRRHLVERPGPGSELVLALDGQPRVEQALGERLRRNACLPDGAQRPSGEHDSDQPGEQHEDRDAGQENVPELRELVAEPVLRE